MNFYILFIAIGFVGAAIHLFFERTARNRERVLEVLLSYLLPTLVGLMGLWGFLGHLFLSVEVAHRIGWPSGNPFQKEIAFANLAFGILGMLCIWIRGNFWLATILGSGVFLWGAASVHIWDIIQHHNLAPDNAGAILYLDILIPLILLTLYLDLRFHQRKGPG